MKRREGCGPVSPLASYVLRLNRAFCGKSLLHCSDNRGLSLRVLFSPFSILWRVAFIRVHLWLLLASDRNRFASVRILSISIFIRTMPSQCV